MIPFRTQRLATSVVNRILDVYDGLPPRPGPGMLAAPDPLPQGAQLDAQLQAPAAPSEAPDDQTAAAIALKAGRLL